MSAQVELDFEGGLLQQFPEFMDCVRASVHGCGRQFKAIAADLDMSPSELSRKLADNPNDQVHFPLQELPRLIEATRDMKPLYWLVEAFLEDSEAKRRRMNAELATMLPKIKALLEAS